jgi:hypothetical protein
MPSCVGTGRGATLEAVASKIKRLACGCAHKQLAKANKSKDVAGKRITDIPFKARTSILQKEQNQYPAPEILSWRNSPLGIANRPLVQRHG